MSSPTQRSLKKLRDEGYTAEVVEKWNPHARKRKDLFNVIDVLAIKEGEILGVQVTSASNISARIKKIEENEHTPIIRKAGIALHIHGWRKNSKNRWVCRVVDVS